MTPTLIENPIIEPVPLAEMKDWLRLASTDEDGVIQSLIAAARLTVEAATGQILIAQKWRISCDDWPPSGQIRIPLRPLISCDAVRVHTGPVTTQNVPASAYEADLASDPPRLVLCDAVPAPGRRTAAIEIDVTAGHGTEPSAVPAGLRQAIRLLTAYWYEHRGDTPCENPPLPANVVTLLAAARRVRV